MPRRPKKDANGNIIKKLSVNPGGRPKVHGVGISQRTKEINNDLREAFALLLQKKIPELEQWLTAAAERNPIKALEIFTAISERFLPSLSRTEITGADWANFTPINITIPTLNFPAQPVQIANNEEVLAIQPTIQQPGVLAPPPGFSSDTIDDSKVSEVSEGDTPPVNEEFPWVVPTFQLPQSALQAKAQWEATQTPGQSMNPRS